MNDRPRYLTTPIYYVNDLPHIGHAYTTVLGDVIARYQRLLGRETFYLTGTDEHGQKVEQAARAAGVEPIAHCDRLSRNFRDLWAELGISNDDFVRTTEPRHVQVVERALTALHEKGEIYFGAYEGWYCVYEENFWTDKDLVNGNCPDCGRPVQRLQEKGYFFRLSKYRDWLCDRYASDPDSIRPESRRNEVLGFLRQPLSDLNISRPKSRLSWGIEIPFDRDYVTYVWFDALLNYVTGAGYLTDDARFAKWWPARYHLVGKDILVPSHSVYWPAMLRALGLEPPRTIVAHGWWLSGGRKMSKSLGNVVRPADLVGKYGVDAFRFFLLREMRVGQDSDITGELFQRRYVSELADDLGNLVSRVLKMVARYFDGAAAAPPDGGEAAPLRALAADLASRLEARAEALEFDQLLDEWFSLFRRANKLVEDTQPWAIAKDKGETAQRRLREVLYGILEAVRIGAAAVAPVLPGTAAELRRRLALPAAGPGLREALAWGSERPSGRIDPGAPLFPKPS